MMVIDAKSIVRLQDAMTTAWHQDRGAHSTQFGVAATPLLALVEREHAANFDLWHEEDGARDPKAEDAAIARIKRSIDRINQQRNDAIEALDDLLLETLPPMGDTAPLHSETPGMIIDRLSILALKIFHMREQAERVVAGEEHVAASRAKLQVLEAQRSDLQAALGHLAMELEAGSRRFKRYRQMKMYNDPALNPAVYGRN